MPASAVVPTGPIITLVYRVAPANRQRLMEFLTDAFDVYERPGGIRMGLYESVDDPGLLLELVAYVDDETYERDQERVENDPEMKKVLEAWRALVDGDIEVRRLKPVPVPRS